MRILGISHRFPVLFVQTLTPSLAPVSSAQPTAALLPSTSCASTESRKKPHDFTQCAGFLGPQSVAIIWMRSTRWRSTTSAVQAANVPAFLRRALAPSPCTLSRCIASWRGSKAQNRVHGVNVVFRHHPPPPCVTSPTMACPPSCTVTRSTRTTCCALARCFLSASIWARYVRLRRVIDRS